MWVQHYLAGVFIFNRFFSQLHFVLRHSVPLGFSSVRGIAYWVVEINAALCRATRTKKSNISFPQMGIEPTTLASMVTRLCQCTTTTLPCLHAVSNIQRNSSVNTLHVEWQKRARSNPYPSHLQPDAVPLHLGCLNYIK